MAFILANQRDSNCSDAFAAYRSYLASVVHHFPPSAYALATSDWYFGAARGDHGPHDAHLIHCSIEEPTDFDHRRRPSIKVRLLEAYGDGFIEISYPEVYNFDLSYKGTIGHQDWRYDEFRLSNAGNVIHEIEWSGAGDTGHWTIEASDVLYSWVPRQKAS